VYSARVGSSQQPDDRGRADNAFKAIRDLEEKAPGPELVARTIRDILAAKKPRFRYLIGSQARNTSRLQWLLPEALYDGKRKVFRLDG